MRIVIQNGTLQDVKSHFYRLSNGKVILNKEYMHAQIIKTTLYVDVPNCLLENKYETMIEVIDGDCGDVALTLQQKGLNPVLLNMANKNQPGGAYKSGSGAQEENLHRRTNLFQFLEDPEKIQGDNGGSNYYPLPDSGAIYTPNVLFFRDSEARGYQLFSEPKLLSFITCAAIKKPKTFIDPDGHPQMNAESTNLMLKKMRTILGVGLVNGHDSAVLSAFGCGAYSCPAHHVATLFKQVINEFSGSYKQISFAIIDDYNSKKKNPEGNVLPFCTVFETEVTKLS